MNLSSSCSSSVATRVSYKKNPLEADEFNETPLHPESFLMMWRNCSALTWKPINTRGHFFPLFPKANKSELPTNNRKRCRQNKVLRLESSGALFGRSSPSSFESLTLETYKYISSLSLFSHCRSYCSLLCCNPFRCTRSLTAWKKVGSNDL